MTAVIAQMVAREERYWLSFSVSKNPPLGGPGVLLVTVKSYDKWMQIAGAEATKLLANAIFLQGEEEPLATYSNERVSEVVTRLKNGELNAAVIQDAHAARITAVHLY